MKGMAAKQDFPLLWGWSLKWKIRKRIWKCTWKTVQSFPTANHFIWVWHNQMHIFC